MARISHALARLRRDPVHDLPFGDRVDQLLEEQNVVWRERLLPPLVTLRLFLVQILNGNCAIAALRHLGGIDFAAASYCEARGRLPLQLLQSLLRWVHDQALDAASDLPRLARRVFVADGSTYSMPDTPELSAHFHLPPGGTPGVGYPMGKIMGLLDLATGMFTGLVGLPLFEHDARSGLTIHPMLRAGDILLGDRAFCGFAQLAMLQARGVFACMRLHQRRKDLRPGLQKWDKPKQAPAWLTAGQFQLLPPFIHVRVVRHTVEQKGFRTKHLFIATTLLEEGIWPDAKISGLYGRRWQIETCFNHLKTAMKMNVLRCKTLEGVMKELAVYLLAYNLVRLAILKAARAQGVDLWRVSFVDAMRWLAARMIGLEGVGRLVVNPDRRGRSQLRVIRRRLKEYDLLVKPRRQTEAQAARKQVVTD